MSQKIGIEIEACFDSWEDKSRIRSEFPRWQCVDDGSLHGVAFEVRLDGPCEIEDIETVAEELETISDKYNARGSVEDSDEFTGSWDAVEENGFDTGLHIHFGLPEEYSIMNIFKLVQEVSKNQDRIYDLGARNGSPWARPASLHFENVQSGYNYFYSDRYVGLNLTNVGYDSKNTIEFRYAHASVGFNKADFMRYFNFLREIWERTMYAKAPKVIGYKHNGQAVFVEEVRKTNRNEWMVNFVRNNRTETKLFRTS